MQNYNAGFCKEHFDHWDPILPHRYIHACASAILVLYRVLVFTSHIGGTGIGSHKTVTTTSLVFTRP